MDWIWKSGIVNIAPLLMYFDVPIDFPLKCRIEIFIGIHSKRHLKNEKNKAVHVRSFPFGRITCSFSRVLWKSLEPISRSEPSSLSSAFWLMSTVHRFWSPSNDMGGILSRNGISYGAPIGISSMFSVLLRRSWDLDEVIGGCSFLHSNGVKYWFGFRYSSDFSGSLCFKWRFGSQIATTEDNDSPREFSGPVKSSVRRGWSPFCSEKSVTPQRLKKFRSLA
jgi:hypothetical protein